MRKCVAVRTAIGRSRLARGAIGLPQTTLRASQRSDDMACMDNRPTCVLPNSFQTDSLATTSNIHLRHSLLIPRVLRRRIRTGTCPSCRHVSPPRRARCAAEQECERAEGVDGMYGSVGRGAGSEGEDAGEYWFRMFQGLRFWVLDLGCRIGGGSDWGSGTVWGWEV